VSCLKSSLPPFCSQYTEAGLGRFACDVGMICAGLHDAESTMPTSINKVNNVLRIILTSIRTGKSSIPSDLGKRFFVRHFTY
jgi:hypothetical protein